MDLEHQNQLKQSKMNIMLSIKPISLIVTSFIQGKPIAYRETGEHLKHMEFFGKQIGLYHRISIFN